MSSQLWQRLRAARKYADLTQAQLAAVCGITRSGYAFFETSDSNARTRPHVDQIMAISKLTKVPVEWLLNDASEPGDVWKIGVVSSGGPKPQAPRATGGGYQPMAIDRAEETFWRAVEYHVGVLNQDVSNCFDVPIEIVSITMRIRYLNDKVMACFTSHIDDQSVLFYLGRMLVAERALGNGHHKHLLVWDRNDTDLSSITAVAQRLFAVSVKAVRTAEEAAAYLLSLQ